MADPECIIVAPPTLTKKDHRVKKRERKADKAFGALSYGVRRSIRLVVAESIEYARAAPAKAPSSPSSSASSSPSTPLPPLASSGIRSTRSTRVTRSMLSTPPTPSAPTMPTPPNTTTATARAAPKTNEQDDPRRSPLVPTQRKNWYRIKGIINEATRGGKTSYLVEWEGYDPSTGVDWPAEWLDSSAVSKPAIKVWKRERDEYMANI